jgi:hypothetical protein
VNSKRGRDYALSIRAGKLQACPYIFLNFKGTQSQEEHKTNFSKLKINEMGLFDQIDCGILRFRKPLKMVLCFSCDGVPLKFKKKIGQASNLPVWLV